MSYTTPSYRTPAGRYEEPDTRLPFKAWVKAMFKDMPEPVSFCTIFGGAVLFIFLVIVGLALFPWVRIVLGVCGLVLVASPVWFPLVWMTRWAWRHKNNLRVGRR